MPLRLDVRHYETLAAVIEVGSITTAAKRLMVTQSALSHRLAEAEKRLGRPLFERGGGRLLRPTPAGLSLYQTAVRVLGDLERAESDFLRSPSTPVDVVRLGVASYDNYEWFPGFTRFVAERAPEIVLELAVVGSSPSTRLLEGALDVVIAPAHVEGALLSRSLFRDELVLIVGPDHRLAGRVWVGPEVLADEIYLTYSRDPAPGYENDRFVRPAGVTPRTVIVIEQPGAIAQMVASGLGVSILSRWAMSSMIEAGRVHAVACGRKGLRLEWSALFRPSSTEDAPEQLVVDLLAEWLAADT